MFILNNFLENFDKLLIVELYVMFYILLSICFFSFIWIFNPRFFFPLITSGYIYNSIYTLVLILFVLVEFTFLETTFCHFRFILDNYTLLCKFIIIFFSMCFFLVAAFIQKNEQMRVIEYFFIIWISILSLLFLSGTFDFFVLFLIIELQSLSLYVLATFNYTNLYSTEAGLKYFTLSSFSTGFILFGIVLLYGISGTLNFEELQSFLALSISFDNWMFNIVLFSLILILIGFMFKLSAAPFHFWAVDVYDGSPTLSVFFFLILPKTIILLVLFRLFFFVFTSYFYIVLTLLIICALMSLLIGNFGALYELKVKRFITYSGIANIGLLLIGIYIFNLEGLQLLFFFLFLYFFTLVLFFAIFNITRTLVSGIIFTDKKAFILNKNFKKIKYFEDYIPLFFVNPILAWLFSLCIFSLAGIPPLMGFFFKFFVIFTLSKQSLYFLATLLIGLNFVGYIYYGRFVRVLFFDNLFKNYYWAFFAYVPRLSGYIIAFFSIVTIIFFIAFLPLFVFFEFFLLNSLSI